MLALLASPLTAQEHDITDPAAIAVDSSDEPLT
jgi:hypothetical protein